MSRILSPISSALTNWAKVTRMFRPTSPAHGILGIECVHGDEGDAVALEQFDEIEEVEHRTRQPIDFVDDDDVDFPGVDVGQEPLQGRALKRAA